MAHSLKSLTLHDGSRRSYGRAFQVVEPQQRRPGNRMRFIGSAAQSIDVDWRRVNVDEWRRGRLECSS